MFRKLIIPLAFALGSTSALSSEVWNWSGNTVNKLYFTDNQLVVYLSGSALFDGGTCGTNRMYIGEGDGNYQAKVSGLMAAFAMGKKIFPKYQSPSSSQCQVQLVNFQIAN